MLGSATLHGWTESAIYLTIKDEIRHIVECERESRAFPKRARLDITYELEDPGSLGYSVKVSASREDSNEVLDLIYDQPGISLQEMADKLKKSRKAILRVVSALETTGRVVIEDGGGRGKPSRIYPAKRSGDD